MGMAGFERIVLIGFSGSGKTTVARLLASELDWPLADTDADIEREFGCSVPEIFARDGEPVFRAAERRHLLAALDRDRVVVATGGGAVVDPGLWAAGGPLAQPKTLVVALDAEPETMLDRMRRQQERDGAAVARPMIAGDDPLRRIAELKHLRQQVYDRAAITLVVDKATPGEVAAEIADLAGAADDRNAPTLRLEATSGISDIWIAAGSSERLGGLARERWPAARRAWIVSDEPVAALHGDAIRESLTSCGFAVDLKAVPSGEGSKSWATAGSLLDWLLDGGIERGDVVVALGGGVVGDLAGFVAATVLRGVPLVQVPTSLLAMVDSSIGGKTGLNHRTGKNLIGAFYQPPLVVIDPRYLATLPQRELTAGWAEVIKHGVIQPSTPGGERADLLPFLERNADRLLALEEPALTYAIRRNVALKAAVVQADERESGIRAYLNFGHTIGHGIEAAGYRMLHGEAVAVGMRAAVRLASELDMVSDAFVGRFDALLDRFGLPRAAPVDVDTVLARMGSDKKRAAGAQRWVLPTGNGVTIRADVPTGAGAFRTAAGRGDWRRRPRRLTKHRPY